MSTLGFKGRVSVVRKGAPDQSKANVALKCTFKESQPICDARNELDLVVLLRKEKSTCNLHVNNNKVRELGIRGIVHYEFVPTGQTVNQVYYLEVLKRMRDKDGNDPNVLPTTNGSCITTMYLLTRNCL